LSYYIVKEIHRVYCIVKQLILIWL